MEIEIPEFCLIMLVGCSGSGKTSFAARHFRETEIVSSDHCRALICDDENDQNVNEAAFELVHFIVERRLAARKLTVVDATSLEESSRQELRKLAKEHHAVVIAVVLTVCLKELKARLAARPDRHFPAEVLERQFKLMERSKHRLEKEGFRHVHLLEGNNIQTAVFSRRKMRPDWSHVPGPFDLIGDVHGCIHELKLLLAKLGYQLSESEPFEVVPPEGRHLFFLGDLVDRGPDSPQVLRVVMDLVKQGHAFCLMGNHEAKLLRKLSGHGVKPSHGLEITLQQLEGASSSFLERIRQFFESMESHYVLDEGRLVAAHAGMPENMQCRETGAVHAFGLYGKSSGKVDERGFPIRLDWASDYEGHALVVYGHTPVATAEWRHNTICIDTGCVFGGELTALRYPEMELVSVPAERIYYQPGEKV